MTEQRERVFFVLVLVQVGHPHPSAGTPTDVPVPRKINSPWMSFDLGTLAGRLGVEWTGFESDEDNSDSNFTNGNMTGEESAFASLLRIGRTGNGLWAGETGLEALLGDGRNRLHPRLTITPYRYNL